MLIPAAYTQDPRFAPYIKWSAHWGLSWRRMAIKADMREAFWTLERECFCVEDAWFLVEAQHLALDACRQALPEWADEFEDRFNEKVRALSPEPMPRFEIQPAVRAIRNVMIGLCGAPGGGKTCSALRLATGLAASFGGRIILIDTECGRSTEFAAPAGAPPPNGFDPENPVFEFDVLHLEPPFSPDRYRIAVATAARSKPSVLIIDNITHELTGTGGQLEMRDQAGPGDKFGWRAPKAAHLRLMNTITQRPWYVILCVRAKERIRPAGPGQGIINDGWLPQCDGSLPYECTLFQLVEQGIPCGISERPWKLPASMRRLVPTDRPLDENTGRAIAAWAQPEGTWTESDA